MGARPFRNLKTRTATWYLYLWGNGSQFSYWKRYIDSFSREFRIILVIRGCNLNMQVWVLHSWTHTTQQYSMIGRMSFLISKTILI